MNERIRELNMQAAEYATSVCPTHSRDWYPIQNTKFAELIVRECADYIQHFYGDIAASSIGNDIKLHFGIEE